MGAEIFQPFKKKLDVTKPAKKLKRKNKGVVIELGSQRFKDTPEMNAERVESFTGSLSDSLLKFVAQNRKNI